MRRLCFAASLDRRLHAVHRLGRPCAVPISLRAAKRHDTAPEDREIGPAERRLIDRLSEHGVLPPGRSPLVRRAGGSSHRCHEGALIGPDYGTANAS